MLWDAIKIAVPSVTGLTASFISGSTRGHECEKERRRRRQDLIERSLDDFETSHATFELLAGLYSHDEIPSDRPCHSSSPIAKAGVWASAYIYQSPFQIMIAAYDGLA